MAVMVGAYAFPAGSHTNHDHARQDGERWGGSMEATATAPAPQHMRALAQANRVRLARAELKRQVAEGETTVGEIVLECPWEADSMAIADLLLSQHRWGRTRCRRFLASIPMSETKTVGSMTDRQRRALAARLQGDVAESDATDSFAMAGLGWAAR
jgi:hypothetical protein